MNLAFSNWCSLKRFLFLISLHHHLSYTVMSLWSWHWEERWFCEIFNFFPCHLEFKVCLNLMELLWFTGNSWVFEIFGVRKEQGLWLVLDGNPKTMGRSFVTHCFQCTNITGRTLSDFHDPVHCSAHSTECIKKTMSLIFMPLLTGSLDDFVFWTRRDYFLI